MPHLSIMVYKCIICKTFLDIRLDDLQNQVEQLGLEHALKV